MTCPICHTYFPHIKFHSQYCNYVHMQFIPCRKYLYFHSLPTHRTTLHLYRAFMACHIYHFYPALKFIPNIAINTYAIYSRPKIPVFSFHVHCITLHSYQTFTACPIFHICPSPSIQINLWHAQNSKLFIFLPPSIVQLSPNKSTPIHICRTLLTGRLSLQVRIS